MRAVSRTTHPQRGTFTSDLLSSLLGRHQAKEGPWLPRDNKAAVLRFYEEVINGTDLDVIDELLTPDGVDHTFGSQSAEEAKQFFGMLYQAFPDLRVEVTT
jgi:hypothetical protein